MNRTHIESACEEIDAAIFSGDILYDDADRTELLEYVTRWLREIQLHNSGLRRGKI